MGNRKGVVRQSADEGMTRCSWSAMARTGKSLPSAVLRINARGRVMDLIAARSPEERVYEILSG